MKVMEVNRAQMLKKTKQKLVLEVAHHYTTRVTIALRTTQTRNMHG